MKQSNWIIIALVVILGAYTYVSNQQVKTLVHDQTASAIATAREMASAATAAQEAAKAAQQAASAAQVAAESAADKASSKAIAAEAAAIEAAKSAQGSAKAVATAEPAKKPAKKPAMMPPFGSEHDVGYAGMIWKAMLDQNLAGPDMLRSTPYEGTEPHGMMLELFKSQATIDGHTGDLIVKRNFGPMGVTADQVLSSPEKHLGAITVMFRREKGFDPEDKNWFWVKFLPDGSIDKNPAGMSLAGKVAKGMDMGCIACHSAADGEDFVFSDLTLK